ncbi:MULTISPECIES: helix-turn-helix domain-containing protein [Amycolatopsis]|uniref:helix-turn-helix domain-containing protein n=1 Tax=Amycolatopsis TaxID=1813 RepID=UPI001E3553B2|nr:MULTISPECIES: helix-turn-helix transcriptional regulator [Amycolatopsis]
MGGAQVLGAGELGVVAGDDDDLGTVRRGDLQAEERDPAGPTDVGIASYGARRVPGLRREELAQLAGVSVTCYTRLEQGQSHQASEAVLEPLARALELTDDQRDYLHNLARPAPARPRTAAPARACHSTRQLIGSLSVPAVLVGMRTPAATEKQKGPHRIRCGPSESAYCCGAAGGGCCGGYGGRGGVP